MSQGAALVLVALGALILGVAFSMLVFFKW